MSQKNLAVDEAIYIIKEAGELASLAHPTTLSSKIKASGTKSKVHSI
jgi:hypothetical protein